MKTIWKFPLKLVDRQTIEAPGPGAIFLVARDPREQLCMWVFVDTDEDEAPLEIHIFGTGHPIENDEVIAHVGSVVAGEFVWHVYCRYP